MALVIELGQGLPNSQSYATVAELEGYARVRGATIPASTVEREVLLIKAMDYLESISNYVGDKATEEQALQWPRIGAMVERWPIRSDEIPRQLVQAQCAIAIEAQNTDFLPLTEANAPGPVTSESISGAVSVTYANPGIVSRVPASAKADALLRTLLKRSGLFAVRA